MKNIYDYTLEELKKEIKWAPKPVQIYNWLYKKYAISYDDMKNIPKDLKENLEQNYPINIGKIVRIEKSTDGSIKYLFEYKGGHTVEAVLLLMKEEIQDENGNITQGAKYTFCVSSQVGCKVGCSFCLTA